jgi:hypothetical protein
MEFRSGNQPAEPGEERSIRWSQSRAGHLPSKDGHLVSKHNDLDGQIRVVGPLQAEDLDGPEDVERGLSPQRPWPREWSVGKAR